MDTLAARNDSDNPKEKMNGYYTWPRLGYNGRFDKDHSSDGPLGRRGFAKLQKEFPGVSTIRQLFTRKGGKEWWQKNGWSMELKFDLKAGSKDRKVLDDYLAEKAAAHKKGGPMSKRKGDSDTTDDAQKDGQRQGDEIDLDEEDERILDKIWEKIAEEEGDEASTEQARGGT